MDNFKLPLIDRLKKLSEKTTNVATAINLNFPMAESDYTRSIGICYAPNGNCQVFSIMYFNIILSSGHSAQDIVAALGYISFKLAAAKPIVLVDVKHIYTPNIDRIFKDYIIVKTPYISTNGSSMCLYLIKVDFRSIQ